MSFKRHSKSTFDSGFESGLSDILDEILGGGQYDPVLEESMVGFILAVDVFPCFPDQLMHDNLSMKDC